MVGTAKQDNGVGSILIGRCNCDPIVKYTSFWCEEVISEAREQGYSLIDLKNENFTESNFNKCVLKNKPSIILLMICAS